MEIQILLCSLNWVIQTHTYQVLPYFVGTLLTFERLKRIYLVDTALQVRIFFNPLKTQPRTVPPQSNHSFKPDDVKLKGQIPVSSHGTMLAEC